jgi:hypothetical protein
MLDTIAAHISALPLAIQLIGIAVILSLVDFAFAVITPLKNGDFHGTRLGQWVTSKGLPIITIAILYGLDAAVKLVPVQVGAVDLGAFGALAYAQAISFIAQEAFSVVKNAKLFASPPVDEPVPDEVTGG